MKKQWLLTLVLTMFFLNSFSQCTEFYGIGLDTIFKTDSDLQNNRAVKSFYSKSRIHSSIGVKAANGKYYGIAGSYDYGADVKYAGGIFEWDPLTNQFFNVYEFNDSVALNPVGNLIYLNDSLLYGMTSTNENGHGILYSWNTVTHNLCKEFEFEKAVVRDVLLSSSNAKIYGMVEEEYPSNGKLFEWDPVQKTFIVKHEFPSREGSPAALLEAGSGKVYGMTWDGNPFHYGYFFEWDPENDNFLLRFEFNGQNGKSPGSLAEGPNGKIYGITHEGGKYGIPVPEQDSITFGVFFEWDPASLQYRKIKDFETNREGRFPVQLIKGINGNLYVQTSDYLGGDGRGMLYEYDISHDSLIRKFTFNKYYPYGGLKETEEGIFLGSSRNSLFRLNLNNDLYERMLAFNNESWIDMRLVSASNDLIYGIGLSGGSLDYGMIFEINRSSDSTLILQHFTGENGIQPLGLIKLNSGNYLGITRSGGRFRTGLIFEWNPVSNEMIIKHEFKAGEISGYPSGALTMTRDGRVFGVSGIGGYDYYLFPEIKGGLYEWDMVHDSVIKRAGFAEDLQGYNPMGRLVEAQNGKLYGLTYNGGVNNGGVLFEYNPVTNTLLKKHDFPASANPTFSMTGAPNGKLYGLYSFYGHLFEWDPDSSEYKELFTFDYDHGGKPISELLPGVDKNKLYGFVDKGIYEWDILQSQMTLKSRIYSNGNLIEVPLVADTTLLIDECDHYISPYGKILAESGVYIDTLRSTCGCDSLITLKLTIHKTSVDTMDIVACDSYISPAGNQFTFSGTYADSLKSIYGCDSVIITNLCLHYSTSASIDTTVNEEYISPGGNIWNVPGTYFDTIPNVNGCDSLITIHLIIESDTATGIQDRHNNTIRVYPLPSNGIVHIDFGATEQNADVEISDLNGHRIFSSNYHHERIIQLTPNLIPGTYVITIFCRSTGAIYRSKLVIHQ